MDGAVKSALNPGGTTAEVGGQNRRDYVGFSTEYSVITLLEIRKKFRNNENQICNYRDLLRVVR